MGMHTVLLCDVKGLERLVKESRRGFRSNLSAFYDGSTMSEKAARTKAILASMPSDIDKIRNKDRAQ